MIESYFLLAPLAVLAVFLLFRFVGCSFDPGGAIPDFDDVETEDTYEDTILTEPSLVSYWRLQEKQTEQPTAPTTPNTPVAGGAAKDEHTGNDGTYHRVIVQVSPPPTDSPNAPGILTLESGGLLDLQPSTSLFVNGGYVEVAFSNSLLLSSFTVEALVRPEWGPTETGLYRTVIAFVTGDFSRGFAVYSGPEDPAALTGPPVWQVWLGDGTDFQHIKFNHGSLPLIDFNRTNYVAVTYDDATKKLNLYTYTVGIDLDDGPFNPVQNLDVVYAPNADPTTKLLIGIERTAPPLYPFNGRIQEVAVYNQALTMQRIMSHIGAGLNLV